MTCSATIPPPSAPPFSKRGIGLAEIGGAVVGMGCSGAAGVNPCPTGVAEISHLAVTIKLLFDL